MRIEEFNNGFVPRKKDQVKALCGHIITIPRLTKQCREAGQKKMRKVTYGATLKPPSFLLCTLAID